MKNVLMEALRVGARFETEGENLRVISPPGSLTAELQHKLKLHKADILRYLRTQGDGGAAAAARVDPGSLHEPFPLTDLQHAYWLGRDGAIELGNISTHWYTELEFRDLDVARLEGAFRRLIDRHAMLRAVILPNGQQQILPEVPPYAIAIRDESGGDAAGAEAALAEVRDGLSHQVFPAESWPLFEVRATLLPEGKVRIHFSVDLIILDATSITLLFEEWFRLYRDPEAQAPRPEISFRDYVIHQKSLEDGAAFAESKAYWMDRLETLPPAPELPVRALAAGRGKPRFSRRNGTLGKTRWERFKAAAGERGLTPTGALLAAYAEVLSRWSAKPHFTLNMIVANRKPVHREVGSLLGVFTSVTLQEVDRRDADASFLAFAARLQRQTALDMRHRDFSGVRVIREWARRKGSALQAVMPVVFNSTIAGGAGETMVRGRFGEHILSLAQTSQVYLENHVAEHDGNLIFYWDAIDAVFEPGVLDGMFGAFDALLGRLADLPSAWDDLSPVPLPEDMEHRRVEADRTEAAVETRRLHSGFVAHARSHPGDIAVISSSRTLTYGDLLAESAAVADWLLERGLRPGQPVAILMRKGWEQVVAVYGVLLAGGAYMPVNADLPAKRKQDLLAIGGVAHVLAQSVGDAAPVVAAPGPAGSVDILAVAGARAEFGARHETSLSGPPEALAYVIFTSGTTGVPKGVMIDHRGALNTIAHVNRLFEVGAGDRALGVSSLSFDLSVYDIFGLLDVGGSLVVPDGRKGNDAAHWQSLVAGHAVTVWNSAPQLMNLLMDGFDPSRGGLESLRTVMLSGDFIPLDLPGRIRERVPGVSVISLGGATEASIWSNFYRVSEVAPSWQSIPYGRPLPNQTMRVLDGALRPCPDHVVGRIHIGGMGLAMGYWGDPELTASRFIAHPATGERLYDTGDLGQYAPDGNILILGRADRQVKVRGYRIELDEIQTVLNRHPSVRQSLVIAVAGPGKQNRLAAYVLPSGQPAPIPDLKAFLAESLPDYMVPQTLQFVDQLPISANGKVDYKALPPPGEEPGAAADARTPPRTPLETRILAIWVRVTGNQDLGVTDSFFESGGDSITAANLVRVLNTELGLRLEMHEFLENFTVEALARLLEGKSAAAGEAASASPSIAETLRADVRTALESFSGLAFRPCEAAAASPRAVLLTGATGWLGTPVLAEILAATGARVYCLIRPGSAPCPSRPGTDPAGPSRPADGGPDWAAAFAAYGLPWEPAWGARIEVIAGDLSRPRLGLSGADWSELAREVDSIYHLGAQLNLLFDYSALRKVNVEATADLVRLAAEGRPKRVFFASPMAVCMRLQEGAVRALTREAPLREPDGMLTGYAQSKWVSESILLAAAGRGLSATVYRSSHALPSSRNGLSKPKDSFLSVLKLAGRTGVLPQWPEALFHGLPVDLLARHLVADSLARPVAGEVVHLDNPAAPGFVSVLGTLLGIRDGAATQPESVPFAAWRGLCGREADRAPSESAQLGKALVGADGRAHPPVAHMFGGHAIGMENALRSAGARDMRPALPEGYWEQVFRHPGWEGL